ncbi:MAG: hypothetical protein HY675_13420 [Chloroflexi bacterium]|nr:hypothetical protein [Chloroflexota bacterium]
MSFKWKEYLDLARFLLQVQGDVSHEASWRCAVSRAYYAAFCHARNYARDRLGYQPAGGAQDHSSLVAHYRSNQSEIADWLDELRSWRNLCDYRDNVYGIDRMPQLAIFSAQQVFDGLE